MEMDQPRNDFINSNFACWQRESDDLSVTSLEGNSVFCRVKLTVSEISDTLQIGAIRN